MRPLTTCTCTRGWMIQSFAFSKYSQNFTVSEPQYLHNFILIKKECICLCYVTFMFIEIIKVGASELIMSTPILSR